MMRVPLRIRGWVCGGLLLVGAVGGEALAQQRDERAPAESVGAELRLLASRADVVFVGQVEKIEVKDGAAGELGGGVVEITFSVEQPVLGVVGGSYVMREWAGRWTGGQQRFQVGERAMFFLHAPSAAGLSSAVDGMMGVVPVVPVSSNGQALLDVRWLATRVLRVVGGRLAGIAGATGISEGGIALVDGIAVAKAWQTDSVVEPRSVRLPEGLAPQAEVEKPAMPVSAARGQGARVGQGVGAMSMKEADDAPR
jgi:hypothetical protein